MSEFYIKIRTNKDLGSEPFVNDLLTSWCNDLDIALRPESFDIGEPVRHSLATEGIEKAVRMWINEGMGLDLKRRSKPKFDAVIDWRSDLGLDDRLFPWGCTVWLNASAGDKLALELFKFLVCFFEPSFGWLTTQKDIDEKHFITFEDLTGIAEQYEGFDVGDTLPGVYWTTYFGPWAIKKIGKALFHNLNAEKVEPFNGGNLVTAYSSSSEIGSPKGTEIEREIMNKLGKEHFFDKSMVDIEALKTSPEEAEEIENIIEEVKAKKKSKKAKS